MLEPSIVRDYVVGIEYTNPFDVRGNRSHMTLRRKVHIEELIKELREIIRNGSSYPQFPSEANPSIVYAWDLTSEEDGDIYSELIEILEEKEGEQGQNQELNKKQNHKEKNHKC